MRAAKVPHAVCAAVALLISACSSYGQSSSSNSSNADANLAKGGPFTVLAADATGDLIPFEHIHLHLQQAVRLPAASLRVVPDRLRQGTQESEEPRSDVQRVWPVRPNEGNTGRRV